VAELLDHLSTALSDRYRIERELGAGGMATVYLARDLKHEREVAIKVLKPDLAAAIGPERFLREIKITAQLNHPHILPLLDSGESDGFLYYVMPYVQGESLRDRLNREKQLSIDDAIKIASEVAEALDAAHEKSSVHRDIKPENILLERGHAVVADFGIARAISAAGGDRLTETGLTLGTPAYMSPEQAGGAVEVDPRGDVYSLGCVVYEMLGGVTPFTGPTPQAVLARHALDSVPSLRTIRNTVPAPLDDAIVKALSKVPADRFRTTLDFAAAIQAGQLPATPRETGPNGPTVSTLARWSIRHHKAVLASGLVLAGMLTGLVAVTNRTPGLVPRRIAVVPLVNQTGEQALTVVGQIAGELFAQSIGNTRLAEVVPPGEMLASGNDLNHALTAAQQAGAGTAIWGTYHRRGDSIEFQVSLLDVSTRRIVDAMRPVRGSINDPMQAIDSLIHGILGALASHFDPFLEPASWTQTTLSLLSYDGYLAHEEARRRLARGDWRGAAEHAERAIFEFGVYRSVLIAADARMMLGQWDKVDSIARVLSLTPLGLDAADRPVLDILRGYLAGDLVAALSASLESAALAPNAGPHFHATYMALWNNRPRLVLELLQNANFDRGFWTNYPFYVTPLTDALHLTRDYREEERQARQALVRFPDLLFIHFAVARALAARGKVEELQSVLQEISALPGQPGWLPDTTWTAGLAMRYVGLELRAHGHAADADHVLHQAVSWYADRPQLEAQDLTHRYQHAEALYAAREWARADSAFQDLSRVSPDHIAFRARLGLLAARRGEIDEAQRVARWLEELQRPYLFGEPAVWRARLAAQMGDLGGAVALLQQAFSQGRPYQVHFHADPDLEPLHGFSPFDDLIKPK